jgi:transposase-like protein
MLQAAIEAEVEEYVAKHKDKRDEKGHCQVVYNGKGYARQLQTGIGNIIVRPRRVLDRRDGERFNSQILPTYMRRVPSIEALLPVLYLKGISGNGFSEALESILGADAKGLSASVIMRLKSKWQEEYRVWQGRSLAGKRFIYIWADGIYFNVRLSKERPCLLVIMGTLADGTKELVGIVDGERESKLSWQELFLDLKRRGMKEAPKLAVGDGALGFWAALEEEFPETLAQRCWVHKTANILDKLPKRVQPGAKKMIVEIYQSDTRENAMKAYEDFIHAYEDKYPKAVDCLRKDKEVLFTFYDFPAAHWIHIRTTNPIESTFATVRHRHRQTKGCGSREATLAMVFKLGVQAEKHWRKIKGYQYISKVLAGVVFKDGIEEKAA